MVGYGTKKETGKNYINLREHKTTFLKKLSQDYLSYIERYFQNIKENEEDFEAKRLEILTRNIV